MRFLIVNLMVAMCAFSALAENEYDPIDVGCDWTMAVIITSPTGQLTEAIARRKIEDTLELNGILYVRCRTWMEGLPTKRESFTLYRKDDSGCYSIDEKAADTQEQTVALYPYKVGATWQSTSGKITVTKTVVEVETVSVAGKTYEHCFHIRTTSSDESYTEDAWEAPIVGSVKSKIVARNGGKMLFTLKEFKSGK
ncbi:MAG: hypothetical protein QOE70_6301 [Chthoniobacter sp.]|jgi:hypothetical protein|nr:hypothetical protein [Chthoniobacter sp.]